MILYFVIPVANNTYLSPANLFTPANYNNYSNNIISFEFYQDITCLIPSTGMTGTLTVNGKMSPNGIWQNIPDTQNPSTVDVSNAQSLQFQGIIQSLQLITSGIANTNFIKILIDIPVR